MYIFDLYRIVLSKITRGFESDLEDLQFLLAQNLIAWDELENHFKGVLPRARTVDIGPKEFPFIGSCRDTPQIWGWHLSKARFLHLHTAESLQLPESQNLLFHVEACVGGLHLSFMRKLRYDVPDFDFTVPGVTSISTDLHKYGQPAQSTKPERLSLIQT